ncbi:hypothetical protein QR680_005979 [Steinernema hermaphroditum]|uniref:G-protein coupled receptors family 1 profile domain-containing protein n=1 Tax=Steinernema hermaphroditum TaxID=289476 RepID=A0AA39LWL6_9BILA|nr:hypothetical protein QR680_005979 [Steinernema hermaphroditum]
MSQSWEIAEKIIVWLEVFGYLLAAPLDIYLIFCLLKSGLLHGNLKIILINLSVTCFTFASGRLTHYFDALLQHLGVGPDNIACRHVQSISQLLYDSSCYMISTSMFIVTIERAIATCIPSSYEQQRGIRRVTIIICVLWSLILGISLFNIFYYKISVPSCDASSAPPSISTLYSNSQHLLLLAGIATVGVTLAGIFLSGLLFFNIKRRKRCDIGQLNLRYQYSENVATLRFLMPVALIYAFILSFVVLFLVLYHLERHSETPNVTKLNVLEQAVGCCGSWFGLLYPLICFYMHRPIRDKVEKDFSALPCLKKRMKVRAQSGVVAIKSVSGDSLCFNDETTIYFDHLNIYWSYTQPPQRPLREPTFSVFPKRRVDSAPTRSPSPPNMINDLQLFERHVNRVENM